MYDGLLGIAFLVTWLSPFALGREAYEWLSGILLFQGAIVALTTILLYKFDIGELAGITVAIVIAAIALLLFLIDADLRSFGLLIPFVWHIYV